MVILMVVPMVDLLILSKIKYERRLLCFDFGMKKSLWLGVAVLDMKKKEKEKEKVKENGWLCLGF